VNINVAELLNGNYILLLFVVLALGLCLGKLRLGSIQLGNSIGVLVVSLLLGQQHFSINILPGALKCRLPPDCPLLR